MRQIVSPLSGIISPIRLRDSAFSYSANNFNPALVFDFHRNYFRKGVSQTSFNSAITHSRLGNATMTGSDGEIKWAPHNLLTYSEDFSNSAWTIQSNAIEAPVANSATAPDGSLTANTLQEYSSGSQGPRINPSYRTVTANQKTTYSAFMKKGTANYGYLCARYSGGNVAGAEFDLNAGTVDSTINSGNYTLNASSITDVGDGWYLCSIVATCAASTAGGFYFLGIGNGTGIGSGGYPNYTLSGKTTYAWGAHLYRSDLGGMVDNPDTGDSYVPTTSAAVYLPRVGNHVYNGTAWVNEGLLLESEARTNLVTYSEDLSNAAWTKGAGVTIGTPVTRKGISLDLIENNGASNFRDVIQSIGSVANGAYVTFSCFVEAGTSTETAIRISEGSGSTNRHTVPITWASGVPTLQASSTLGLTLVSASVQNYGDGLYHVHIATLNNTGGALTLDAKYYVQWNDTAAAVNTYAGGFQAEIASTPSSYIPTAGSTVSRAAETLTVPAANMPWPTPVETTGTELVTNGDFATDSDWSIVAADAASGISGGQAYVESGGNNAYIEQALSLVQGSVYTISFNLVSETSSGLAYLRLTGGTTQDIALSADLATIGINTFTFVAGNSSTLVFMTYGVDGHAFTIDNVSVKEINPLSVSIQMDGRMTYADTGTYTDAIYYRWQSDSNNFIQGYISTVGGDTGKPIWSVKATGVADYATGTSTYYSPGINVPFNVASRNGSTFINGAVDGTALTANTTPVALPDLETADLQLGYDFMGTIGELRVWANDISDTGIATASSPSIEPSLSLTFDGSETGGFTVLDWSE